MYRVVFILLFFLLPAFLFSQEKDSVYFKTVPDTLQNLPSDTTAVNDTTQGKKKSDIDDIVYASGTDSLIFKVGKKVMEIYGSGELKYKKTELKSANIDLDFNTNRIHAVGVKDTTDTTGNKMIGTPVLSDAGEIYEGSSINYDFKTKQGFISLAKNSAEGNYYTGKKVKKVDADTYFIKDGIFTTCNEDPDHYHFTASKMKVILKKQIIAQWIFLYVGGVPLPIPLPFGIFPNKTGRTSGFIIPAYGSREDYGQYLSHFGYFWAINDYVDVNALMDYYFRGGVNLNSRLRYSKRYSLSGSIDVGISSLHSGEPSDQGYSRTKEWHLSAYHHQDINPSTKLDANLQFQSSNYNKQVSSNYNNILAQNISSSASFHKTWDESNNSLSIGYLRNQQLNNGNYTENLPSLTFSMPQSYPFKRKNNSDPTSSKWYELIGYNYTGSFLNRRVKSDANLDIRGGIEHQINSSASPKVGYFNISPSISYTEKWYNKRIERFSYTIRDRKKPDSLNAMKDTLVDKDVHQINAVRSFNIGVSASTKLYGMFNVNSLGINAIRHTLTPSISYSFHPDFSNPKWGFYDYYTNSKGQKEKYNKFEKEVFGGIGEGESQSIGLSIGNLFEMKTSKDATDTTSESKKIQLLNMNASTAYNFVAPSNKLSDLNLSFGTQIANLMTFNGNASYSFYESDSGRVGKRYLYQNGQGLLRLRQFSFSISTSLSAALFSKQGTKKEKPQPTSTAPSMAEPLSRQRINSGLYEEESPDFSIPWDLALSFAYAKDNETHNKMANLRAAFSFSLTQSLKFSCDTGYDFNTWELSTPSVRIYKDLHCWEMNLTWNPIGNYRGYRLEIRVKAPQLQDLKIERTRGQFSGRYF